MKTLQNNFSLINDNTIPQMGKENNICLQGIEYLYY